MFGSFQNGWAGLNQFSDFSEKVQKLKTGLEAGLQDSGLLGPGDVPPAEQLEAAQSDTRDSDASAAVDERYVPTRLTKSPNFSKADTPLGQASTQEIAASSSHLLPDSTQETVEWQRWQHEIPEEEATLASTPAPLDDTGRSQQPQLGLAGTVKEAEAAQDQGGRESAEQEKPETASSTPGEGTEAGGAQGMVPANFGGSPELHSAPASSPSVEESREHDESQQSLDDKAADLEKAATLSLSQETDLGNGGSLTEDMEPSPVAHSLHTEGRNDANDLLPNSQRPSSATADTKGKQLQCKSEEQVDAMPLSELQAWALQLQMELQAREVQLERKFEEVTSMQEVTQQLMDRNEELARKSAKASEEDIKQLTDEYEVRLGASERKVYALSKERDMLKRGSEKLSSANELLKEKDNIIAQVQVMAEGEQLSRKQLQQENTMKKLRQQLKEAETSRKELAAELGIERRKCEDLLEGKKRAESDASAARQAQASELAAEKSHYEGLLAKARSAQVEAENRASSTAKEGLSKKLKEMETKAELLAEQVSDLQMSMERQRSAADHREDILKRELTDMERRNREAEARHEELTNKLPEATRPLLRQIEGMQRTAEAHSQAWRAAEQALQSRLAEAEARAAAAAEKERLASERLQAANNKASSLAAALDALREEEARTREQLGSLEDEGRALKQQCSKLEEQHAQLLAKIELERLELERSATDEAARARQEAMQQVAIAESRAAALEEQLRGQSHGSNPGSVPAAGQPPAMAGPGYKWVLQREGEAVQPQQNDAQPSPRTNHWSSTHRATAPELEQMRDAFLQKEEQLASCQSTISGLEATRDSLAEELVALSQTAEQRADAWKELERIRHDFLQLQQKLMACTELIGEREEKILELTADIADMKALYREQIEYVLDMAVSSSHSRAGSSVSSWIPGPERKD